MSIKGLLIPIGGNEDKGSHDDETHTLDYVHDGILSRVVRESGGHDSHIIVVTTASQIPLEVAKRYIEAFERLGCTNMEVIDFRIREDVDNSETIRKFSKADCVMFSGGDQSRIVNVIGGSTIHDILIKRFKNEKFVIAGTSAGAMAMSQEMISGGSSTDSLVKDSVRMRDGLNLIPGLIIDSHFIKRGRFGRMAEAVAKHPHLLGVGLAEDTGLIIRDCNHITVIGSGMVILFDPANLTHNNVEILEPGTPMTMANLTVHVLANSDRFTISNKEIEVLPIEAEFE